MIDSNESNHEQLEKALFDHFLTLSCMDNDFMRLMFKDNRPLVQYVLRILMKKKDLFIPYSETQKDMVRLVGGRSLELDVFGIDSTGKKYNLEVQREYSKDLFMRLCYHFCIMGVESLSRGEKFSQLRDFKVIFIMNGDIFKDGQPIHHIDLTDHNSPEALYIPGGIHVVNGAYRGDDDLGRLMHDFHCVKADDMLLEPMAEGMRFLKEKKEGRYFVSEYIRNLIKEEFKDEIARESAIAAKIAAEKAAEKAKAEIEKAQAEAENAKAEAENAKKETTERHMKDIALKMLSAKKFSVEDICDVTGLSMNEVLSLRNTLD